MLSYLFLVREDQLILLYPHDGKMKGLLIDPTKYEVKEKFNFNNGTTEKNSRWIHLWFQFSTPKSLPTQRSHILHTKHSLYRVVSHHYGWSAYSKNISHSQHLNQTQNAKNTVQRRFSEPDRNLYVWWTKHVNETPKLPRDL